MNALARTAMKVLPRTVPSAAVPARSMAAESRAHLHKGIPRTFADLRNNIWLSDAGAYPVMAVLVFAVGMCGSYMTYCAVSNPDVRITPTRRQALIRTWE